MMRPVQRLPMPGEIFRLRSDDNEPCLLLGRHLTPSAELSAELWHVMYLGDVVRRINSVRISPDLWRDHALIVR